MVSTKVTVEFELVEGNCEDCMFPMDNHICALGYNEDGPLNTRLSGFGIKCQSENNKVWKAKVVPNMEEDND